MTSGNGAQDRKTHVTTKPFTLASIGVTRARDYPSYETKAKAAKTKMVFLWLCSSTVALYQAGEDPSPHAAIRAEMLYSIQNCVHIMDRGGVFLSRSDADEVFADGTKFLRLYCFLSSSALVAEISAYKVGESLLKLFHRVSVYVSVFEFCRYLSS